MPDRTCIVDGCEKPAPKVGRICEMHRKRRTRHGSDELPPRTPPSLVQLNGYVVFHGQAGHVLTATNRCYAHRVVLFDHIGYGPHRCHYCGTHINWGAGLTVDHVDRVRSNNDPENLVASCQPCNSRRPRLRERAEREAAALIH